MTRRGRTPWPDVAPRVKTVRRLPCLREEDGYHCRCEQCGWYDVQGIPDLDAAVALYDVHQLLKHAENGA